MRCFPGAPANKKAKPSSVATDRRLPRWLHRRCVAVGGAGLLLAAAPFAAARATPTVSLQISASGYATQTFSVAVGSSVNGPTSYAGFTFASITGYGEAIDPAYISLTIQVSKVTVITPLTISLTETGLDAGFGDEVSFSTTNTSNFTSASSATTATYYDTTDTPFGTQNLLFSTVLSRSSSDTSAEALVTTQGLFSVTKTIVWTPGSTSSHPLITSEVDASLPEPLSLSLLGSALLALGTVRRFGRKRQ